MLTKLTIRNFKLFGDIELELGDRVVLVGPNNAGKTSALQALALWDIGVKKWSEKRGAGEVPEKRPGVTINRRDLIAVPVPVAKMLWRDLHTQTTDGDGSSKSVLIEVVLEGISDGVQWECGLEFYYANEEVLYCRPLKLPSGGRMTVPRVAIGQQIAYLPPMSGLGASETRLDVGAINVRLGEGRTAEVLRNLCYTVFTKNDIGGSSWEHITNKMFALFGVRMQKPEYVNERGEITLAYKTKNNVKFDISSSGRGQQQTLLLLTHMEANPGAILLLDEPDAHLEILRQRQIYEVLTETARRTSSQIIAASHSEVLLTEAAERDIVIAFVGKPHRIDDRGSQVRKALQDFGFEHYYEAEEVGWVLYLEGSTDLAILRSFAALLGHPVAEFLERPFVHYVANQPPKAQAHFQAIREAKPDLLGIAIYDRLDRQLPADPYLKHLAWEKRELENYLCTKETLLRFAEAKGKELQGDLFGLSWKATMETAIEQIEEAMKIMSKPSPWGNDIKSSDEFLDPLFKKFYQLLKLPNLMQKTDYHTLAPYVAMAEIDNEIAVKLDNILQVAQSAKPRTD